MASKVPRAERNTSQTTNSLDAKTPQTSETEGVLTEDELELHLWQKAYFLGDTAGSSTRHRADSLRLRLAHLHYYTAKERSSSGSTLYLQRLMGGYLREYSKMVDGVEEEDQGMDNLTAAAKVLSTGHRKDFRQWKSSLTMESMKDLPEVQAALKAKHSVDKPLHCVWMAPPPAPSSSSAQLGDGNVPGPSTSQRQTATRVQKSPTSPYGVFSKMNNQQQSKPTFHPPPKAPGSAPSLPQHSAPSRSSYSSSSTRGRASSSVYTREQRRGKGRPAGGYNYEGYPHSKRARMSNDAVEDEEFEEDEMKRKSNMFITARDQHVINQQKKYGRGGGGGGGAEGNSGNYGMSKRSLGTRRATSGKFVPPVKRDQEEGSSFGDEVRSRVLYGARGPSKGSSENQLPPELDGDERLKNIEPRMVELIMNEIMDHGAAVSWDDIAGLHFAKATIKEIVVWPMLRPDIFKGLRGPPKGILLFGPPGTGKTLIGKCVASQVKATFFSISASSLTSKWVGEGEKMVRALFAVARCYQPAVIFIDEIDSLLSQRSETEHESSRRIKTEFLVQLDGATTSDEDRLLVIGATNRPQEIDEAARRRLVKRLYIPLPDPEARKQIVHNLMKQQPFALSDKEMDDICQLSEGYSGADMANLCREAAYGPIREAAETIQHISADEMRAVLFKDFESAFSVIRPSVSDKDLELYIDWNRQFGCGSK